MQLGEKGKNFGGEKINRQLDQSSVKVSSENMDRNYKKRIKKQTAGMRNGFEDHRISGEFFFFFLFFKKLAAAWHVFSAVCLTISIIVSKQSSQKASICLPRVPTTTAV